MKKTLSAKHRSLLATSASLLFATSVIAPLSTMTSCSNNSEFESYVDREFGITEQTYDDLKEQFNSQYKAQLELEIGDEEKRQELLNDLQKHFDTFENNQTEKKCGYTTLTSALINFSKKSKDARGEKYNVKLTRKSNATWAQVDGIFNSWKGSFRQYMLNSDIPASTITRVMQDAQNKFVSLKKELQQTCNDATDGLIQAKSRLITCFEDVNDEIALVSSTVQLKEFLSQYTFKQKDIDAQDYEASCLDKLLEDTEDGNCDFKVGNILCDDTMNRVLDVIRKDDGTKVPFSSTMVKGHTLLPKLTKITINKLSNVLTFDIDFGLVKTSYISKYSKEKLDNLTAHNYSLNQNNWELNDINSETTLDQLIRKLTPVPITFPIHFTKEVEHQALLDSYFNKDSEKSYLSFEWDNKNSKNQARESFYDNAKVVSEGVWESQSELSASSLINSGIMIVDHKGNKTTKKLIRDAKEELCSNVNDNGIDTHVDTLDQTFLTFCDFSGKVLITETNEHNTVNFTNFYAWYNNSPYKWEENGKVELRNDPTYAVFQTQCIDHEVSDNFFMKINQKFNNVINHISLYDGKVLQNFKNPYNNGEEEEAEAQRLYKAAEEQYIASLISSIGGIVATSIMMGYAYFSSGSSGPASTKTVAVTILLLIAFVITQIVIACMAEEKFNDIKDKAEKAKKFKEEYSQSSPLVTKLNQEATKFVYINEDGSYDKQAFKKAKSNFEKQGMTTMLNQYRMYANPSNIKNAEGTKSLWDEYKSKADEEGIGSDDYKITLDDFLKVGGHYWVISWALTITSIFISIGLAVWIKKDRIRNKEHLNYINSQYYDWEERPDPVERTIHEAMTYNDDRVEKRVNKLSKRIEEAFIKIAEDGETGLSGSLPLFVGDGPAVLMSTQWIMNSIMNVWAATVEKYSEKIWGNDPIDGHEWDARSNKLRDLINKKNGDAYSDRPWDIGKIIELFTPKDPV